MGGLFSALSIAVGAMKTEQGALDVTSNNIANVNTPGYSREQAVLEESPPVQYGSLELGTGVSLESVQSIRDNILNLQLNQETSQQSSLNTQVDGLNQIQALFNEPAGVGLQSAISSFFDSFQQLATDPTNTQYGQQVITAGQNLANGFNQTADTLSEQQQSLDQSVVQTVSQINSLSSQIASINEQVATTQATTSGAGELVDEQTELVQQLSQLVGISVTDASNGTVTVTTGNGSALVVDTQSFALTTQTNATTGFHDVVSQGTDITSNIQGGQLGADIQLRDQEIPSIMSNLDTLAAGIANAVNTTSMAGFQSSGAPGGNFFVPPPATEAAATMAVAITDPSQIATSSDGTTGSNGNANALAALANQNIVDGQTPTNYYAGIVEQVGNDTASAQSQQQSQSLLVQQLQDQQGSVSGVSLNEEAANLIQYQSAYEAAAEVSNIIDQLSQDVIDIFGGLT